MFCYVVNDRKGSHFGFHFMIKNKNKIIRMDYKRISIQLNWDLEIEFFYLMIGLKIRNATTNLFLKKQLYQ